MIAIVEWQRLSWTTLGWMPCSRANVAQVCGGMAPVSWPLIASEMTAWLDQVNALPRLDPALPTRLAQLHSRFEQIHPFLDGNGRAGRLLLNLLLVRLGFPPAIIYKRQRADYLRALRRADGGDPGKLGDLIARATWTTSTASSSRPWPAPPGSSRSGALATKEITADALRTAAVRGRLQATRGPDGQWRSSRN